MDTISTRVASRRGHSENSQHNLNDRKDGPVCRGVFGRPRLSAPGDQTLFNWECRERQLLSNRLATKRAYYRRLERVSLMQKVTDCPRPPCRDARA